MKRFRLFPIVIRVLSALTILALAFIIFFIVYESLPFFRTVPLSEFLLSNRWNPMGYAGKPSYGILPMIAATLLVSAIAVALASYFGIGTALFLSCIATERVRKILYPLIDLLAGIPSVVYGFIGLEILVRLFRHLGSTSGECVLGAGILLAVMILPFLISSCSETMLRVRERYLPVSDTLGVSGWYAMIKMILPLSLRGILTSLILAIGRAMGETMAVMMVMGNAPVFPTLLGKGETIASLIALEMGTASVGSTHFHALYAAGLILMLLLLLINGIIAVIRERTIGKEGDLCGKN